MLPLAAQHGVVTPPVQDGPRSVVRSRNAKPYLEAFIEFVRPGCHKSWVMSIRRPRATGPAIDDMGLIGKATAAPPGLERATRLTRRA